MRDPARRPPGVTNITTDLDGIPFNYFLFTTQAGGGGVNNWRGNDVNSCHQALPMGVAIVPDKWKLGQGGDFTTVMRFPPETKSHGFVCRSGNVGGEGVRLRNTIFSSPTLLGLAVRSAATATGTDCHDGEDTLATVPALVTERIITCFWDRETIALSACMRRRGMAGRRAAAKPLPASTMPRSPAPTATSRPRSGS